MKIILFFACVVFLSANTNAQEIKQQEKEGDSKAQLGHFVGINHSSVAMNYYSASQQTKPAIGYAIGGFSFQYNFSKTSSIHTRIQYEMKAITCKVGYRDEPSGEIVDGIDHKHFHHLMLPILYRARFNNFFVDAGIFIGYAIKLKVKNELLQTGYKYLSWGPDTNYIINAKYTTNLIYSKPFYKGLSAAAGYNYYNTRKIFLSAEIRDDFELTNSKSFAGSNRYRLNTLSLLFSFGYKL